MDQQSPKKPQKACNGQWKRAEHQKFMKAVQKFGRDWVKVQKVIKTRTLRQVRSHAQKYFQNMSKTDVEALIGHSNQDKYPEEYSMKTRRKQRAEDKQVPRQSNRLKQASNPQSNSEKGNIQQEDENKSKKESKSNKKSQKSTESRLNASKKIKQNQHEEIPDSCCSQSIFIQLFRENFDYFMEGGKFIHLLYL